jgi:transposase-like protein
LGCSECFGYGDVVDILVQKRKDKKAAERFFKKLMKGQGRSAREIVTDKLLSSLSDLGNRGEARGKASPFFRSFEEHSGSYATKKIGKMGRVPAAAVDCP